MKAIGWIVAGLVVIGLISGGDPDPDGDSDDTGYHGSYHDDQNGNPVPDDCAAWADSSDNAMGDDPYGYQLCEEWE